jgi:hypothetical protein
MNMPFNSTPGLAKIICNIYQTALFKKITAVFENNRKKQTRSVEEKQSSVILQRVIEGTGCGGL